MAKTPAEIRQQFADCVTGQSDIDINECIWDLLNDVISSIQLAEGKTAGPVMLEVSDYLANHYGDD